MNFFRKDEKRGEGTFSQKCLPLNLYVKQLDRFDGCAVIEVEDKAYEGSREDVLLSIRQSKKYLDQFIGG